MQSVFVYLLCIYSWLMCGYMTCMLWSPLTKRIKDLEGIVERSLALIEQMKRIIELRDTQVSQLNTKIRELEDHIRNDGEDWKL